MKKDKLKKVYLWSFLLSMPAITLILSYIMYGQRLLHERELWIYGFSTIYVIGCLMWWVRYQYDKFLFERYPHIEQTRHRIFYKILVNIFILSPSALIVLFVFDRFHIGNYYRVPGDATSMLIVGFSTNLILETFFEAIYSIEKFKDSLYEKEMLEQMNLRQEFDNLKGKVNPHFLFNCFNTLSSLISENKELAEKFLDELSKVYRYLLRNNEDGMSTVESEMKFIQNYFQLMNTRHGDGIRLSMQIDKKYHPYIIPSLSVQLLVENAIKHNVVSRQMPLSIEIFTTEGKQLVVNNNLNEKKHKEHSTSIGLHNIESKYKLMNQEGFQVVHGEKNFMVVLPMIWKAKNAL